MNKYNPSLMGERLTCKQALRMCPEAPQQGSTELRVHGRSWKLDWGQIRAGSLEL